MHDHDHDHDHDHGDGHHHHHDHGGLKHYHDEDMQSFSLKTDKPLNPDKFFPWVQKLVAEDGPSILRCKGILNFKDDPDRFVFQGVHMILDGDHQRPWKDGEKRDSRSCSSAASCRKKKSARASRAACLASLIGRHSAEEVVAKRSDSRWGDYRAFTPRRFAATAPQGRAKMLRD